MILKTLGKLWVLGAVFLTGTGRTARIDESSFTAEQEQFTGLGSSGAICNAFLKAEDSCYRLQHSRVINKFPQLQIPLQAECAERNGLRAQLTPEQQIDCDERFNEMLPNIDAEMRPALRF